MELLQFNEETEANIITIAEELMFEALPHEQPSDLPADIETWCLDKQFEYWVIRQETPQDRTRLSRIFGLIQQADQTPPFIDSTDQVIPPTSLRELDVLVGSGSGQEHRTHSLAKRIDHTQLHIGYATTMRHLVQVKKKKNLEALQQVVQAMDTDIEVPENLRSSLSQNKAPLRDIMKALLGEVKPIENIFLSFWTNQEQHDLLEDWLKQKESKNIPFGGSEHINFSPWLAKLQQIKDLILPLLTPLATVGSSVAIYCASSGHPLAIISGAFFSIMALKQIPETYRNYKVQIMALHLTQKKLIGLASFIEKLNTIRQLLQAHNFRQELIDSLALPMETPKMQKLTALLNTKTFDGESSFWSHWGKICVAYRLVLKQRSNFINAYLGLGTIDFITSLSSLLASSTEKSPFCFAEYNDDINNAGIEATACWSPLLDRKSVVTNDVALGRENPRTFMVSGPNARGKTTLMRSVAGPALLGSTLGIGSAKKLVIPTNLNFLTSINIGDDPAKNLSLFKAVVARMGHIKYMLEQAETTSRYLIITDEPFIGTDKALAEACARSFIISIAKKTNALALFSSHLDVTHLGEEHPNLIANYHLADGYTFVPGVDPNPEKYYQVALSIIADHNDDEFVHDVEKELVTIRSTQHPKNKQTQRSFT